MAAPATPEPRTRIRLCGPLRIELDGRDVGEALPGGQAVSLLAYLLLRPGHAAGRGELINAVLPGRPPAEAQNALRPLLSRLRRVLAPARLDGRERVQLVLPAPVWLDVQRAGAAVREARAAAKAGRWDSVRDHAQLALGLLRPGFLTAVREEWAEPHRRDVEELELEALEWVARSGLARGGPELAPAVRAGRALIARSPYRETGYRFTMEALAAGGNVAEALRVYDALRILLRDELGASPAAEVQALHQRLLGGAERAPARDVRPVPLPAALAPRERSAFVGRERELELLQTAWRQAREGRRRLVLVAGEAGIGKTRLTAELALQAHAEGVVLHASCPEEALMSYQPFVDALRHYARATEIDARHVALGPGSGELARLVPELSGALPASAPVPPTDPETRRYELFEAVAALLAAAAARAPLLLVLDDLHWGDRATLHLLRHVMRSPHEGPLLIVGTYRDAEVGLDHPLSALLADLRRDRLYDALLLDGLDEVGVGALIASHAEHAAPSGLVDTVHAHTDGNPFFVEEVMRHLIESGVVFARAGRWASALTPDEIGVPEGVRAVLGRRLARLSEGCRTALAQAAVLGREFSFETLAAMEVLEEEPLIAALEEAVEAQLVLEREADAGPAYAFTHALVRETLYAGLSGPRRQRAHARAAAAIERTDGERRLATLAVHHRLAGAAGDADRAIDCSLRAGAQAAELSAWDEAAVHWDGAVEVMARAGGREHERARLLIALADLMVVVDDLGRQIGYLERALALWEALGDDEHAAQAHSRLGMAHSLIDSIDAEYFDVGRAFRHFDAAGAVLGQGSARRARGHLQTGVSTALSAAMRIPEGLETAAEAMAIAEAVGDEVLWAGGAEAYAWHAIVAGRLREGIETIERAFATADRLERPFLAFMGANIRAQLTWGMGAPDEAQRWFERQLTLPYAGRSAYRRQIADGIGRCHISRGEPEAARRLMADAKASWLSHAVAPLHALWTGEWATVAALAETVLVTSRRTGNRWDEWAAEHFAGRVLLIGGDSASACKRQERALAIVAGGGAAYFELWVRPELARALVAQGRTEEARGHVERCRGILGGEDWRGRAGTVAIAEGVVLAAEGRADEADAVLRSAEATLAHHRLVPDRADAVAEHARALALAGAAEAAADRWDEARELYRRHGAGPAWLDRRPTGAVGPRAASGG